MFFINAIVQMFAISWNANDIFIEVDQIQQIIYSFYKKSITGYYSMTNNEDGICEPGQGEANKSSELNENNYFSLNTILYLQ